MKQLTLILLLFCLSLSQAADNKQVKREMRMRTVVQISSRFVQLKDLMVDTTPLTAQEKELIIVDAPRRGHKVWDIRRLAALMQNHKELLDIDLIATKNTMKIKIVRVADKDFVDKVKKSLLEALSAKPQWSGTRIDIEFSPLDLSLISEMSGADQIELVSQSDTGVKGTIKLRTKFSSQKQSLGTISLKPFLKREVELVTLNNSLGKGHILRKSDLLLSKTWSDGNEEKYASTLEECIGFEIKRNVAEGSLLQRNLLAPPIYAERHQIINAYIYLGSLKVTAEVKALTQGRRNETIRVRNTKSGKLMDAVLVAPGQAEVK